MGLFGKPKAKLPRGVAYAEWSCIEDDCSECQALDGMAWISGADFKEPPSSSCQSKDILGCTCDAVLVSDEETGARETAEYIRGLGGIATKQQMTAFDEERRKRKG